jgi:Tol biopolymer transport system component
MENGKIQKTDPKIESMPGNATYPSWHPGGRYIAFSSNQVRQSFYAAASKSIEVFDLSGSMVLYDTRDNKIISISEEDTTSYIRTFPGWSPDGKYLYYCRAVNHISAKDPVMPDIISIHHDLVRKSFDEATETFGKTEIVFAASELSKSVSFPRISPNGKYLVFTLHDYGTFPIWHAEADLYSLDLETREIRKLDLNSDETESYHSWSSNGKWLVFSSKRYDGRTTRPYISFIGPDGKSARPFMLPQKDPDLYNSMIESFNIPELVKGRIMAGPRDFLKATKQQVVKPSRADSDTVPGDKAGDKGSSNTSQSAHQ